MPSTVLRSAIEFACHGKACAPPPVGTGGSISKGGGGSKSSGSTKKSSAPKKTSTAPATGTKTSKAATIAMKVSGKEKLPSLFTAPEPKRPVKPKFDTSGDVMSKEEVRWSRQEFNYLKAKARTAIKQFRWVYDYDRGAAEALRREATKAINEYNRFNDDYLLGPGIRTVSDPSIK